MHIHQGLLSDLLPQVQIVVMVGSRASDHLRELARIAEFKGRPAYRVETASELQPRWFSGVEEVGIIVGASDLEPVVRDVLARLDQFSAAQAKGMLEGLAQ
jgi:4-hydroxy-3-methylbut-2-en-1-yl diphosphate reductase